MNDPSLKANHWYCIRRPDGSLAAYRFHRLGTDRAGLPVGEFFVGSFIRAFRLSDVVGEAQMPESDGQPFAPR